MIIKNCLTCKKEFRTFLSCLKRGGGKYCSRKCIKHTEEWKQRMRGRIPWNKGLKGLQSWHNISGLRSGTYFKGQKRPLMTGKNHPCWVNGNYKKQDKRNDSLYQWWVKQVKKRDNNQCKFKGQNCFGYNIVHHILSWRDYPELRYNVNNGITLCQFHHPRKREDEQKLILTFQELVGAKELI